jgi:hypothetical protein
MSPIRPRALAGLAAVLALISGSVSAAAPANAQAPAAPAAHAAVQALPSPLRFVSSLDLECFKTNAYVPPTTTFLTRHLNPVLANLPAENVTLGVREKLCVPVAKNGMIPPAGIVDFVRFVDLSCYRIQGITVNQPLTLKHLNPLFAGMPVKNIVMTTPQHLCVPVIKNGVTPPAEVLRLVQFIDLKCYLEQPQAGWGANVTLSHLNPVLAGLAPHPATIVVNRQLCVPVAKGTIAIPDDILNIVRWVDLEMYDISTPALTSPITLSLRHINPLLANLPPETAVIQQGIQLGLPVAKNGVIPPA